MGDTMTKLEEIKNALTWLIEQKIRDDRSVVYWGYRVSELTKRVFNGEQIP